MTIRQSLARYVRGLLSEETSTPPSSDPPTPSPESIPTTTTPNTRTTPAVISEEGSLTSVMSIMRDMQRENLQEIRGMVMDILQGRPMDQSQPTTETMFGEKPPLRDSYDPPDYDSTDTSDLPEGIQSIFERHEQERQDLRHLRTEREVLSAQLDEARAMVMDPQGPAFDIS